MKALIGLLLLMSPLSATASSDEPHYFGDRERGWFWYHDPAVVEERPPAAEQPAATPATEEDPQVLLKAYQKRLEDAKALAVMQPTDEVAMRRYLEAQQEAYGRSALFADTWRRVVWSTPELDYSLQHPVNSPGLAIEREQARAQQVAAVSALGQTDGLFFFFSSRCDHCHTQALILGQFGRRYGLKILAISLDDGALPDFPDAVPDNGLAAQLGVEVTPAVFMVNPRDREILPVGYGVMTEVELLQRIYTLTAPRRGQF